MSAPGYEAAADRLRLGVRVSDECLAFARAMDELRGGVFDWSHWLEKPYNWSQEFEEWVESDRPTDSSAPQWETFAAAVEAL